MLEQLKEIPTYADGRMSLYDLYHRSIDLESKYGWSKELIYSIKIQGNNGEINVPVYCFLSPKQGESLWLITGIHGEEPAGPNAVAQQIDYLGKLGSTVPMVIMPLLNPAGYYRNWRFHHVERSIERLNVTDSRHLISRIENPKQPILRSPIHGVADTVTKHFLGLLNKFPPLLYFDLHEDEQLEEGYVYSQGTLEKRDPVAAKVVELFVKSGVPLKMSGETRFAGEKITNGIVTDTHGNRVKDGSVDEFISNETYFDIERKIVPKPFATTSIVTETPGKGILADRIRAQESIVAHLAELWEISSHSIH